MNKFAKQLLNILENLGQGTGQSGKVDILHKSGKHIIADHVKKVRSPKGKNGQPGRVVLLAGIGPLTDGLLLNGWDWQSLLNKNWTYRVKDFYQIKRPSNRLDKKRVAISGRGQLEYIQPNPRPRVHRMFKHVLTIDMRNIISINGQPVAPLQQPVEQRPTAQVQAPGQAPAVEQLRQQEPRI